MAPITRSQSVPAKAPTTAKTNAFEEEYERVCVLGSGGEGTTVLCRHKTSSRKVVAKMVRHSAPGKLPREAEILKDIRPNDHIVSYFGVFNEAPSPSEATILLEDCRGGDLQALQWEFELNDECIPEPFIRHVFLQLSQALAFLHSGDGTSDPDRRPLVHRDIKPANVLLLEKYVPGGPFPSIKLADFGHAAYFTPDQDEKAYAFTGGSRDWQPPERPVATPAGDVWSVGAIVHSLALGRPPIADVNKFRDAHSNAKEIDRDNPRYFRDVLPREVTPICAVEGKEYAGTFGDHACSNTLNSWMMQALARHPKDRMSSLKLSILLGVEVSSGRVVDNS
ncbi:STE protein kinase [Coniosporium apollinis CBS 100218]|uniref:Autophagy-related protein 1 n=1 Tax=Coniosporium apollinis (strain CBS 100218) TaxID=1168221 RepID=R7YVT2_CONA1|nr:STE protein kinase [Coniosporium apollinis CBS 100218]EON65771.1 STE protein kinase [Coniosporium apollinis CBS 100218]